MLLVHLFVCFVRVSFCHFLFLLVSGGWLWFVTPWTFLLTVLKDSNQTIGKTTEFIFLNMNIVNSTLYSVKRDVTSRVFIA